MIVGVTGTRPPSDGFTRAELDHMHGLIDQLPSDTTFVSGGCLGVDGTMTRMAGARGLQTRAYLASYTGQTDWQALKDAGTVIIRTGRPLLARNGSIVSAAEKMLAVGLRLPSQQPRSGTWACARLAQSVHKLHTITVLRPRTGGLFMVAYAELFCLCSTLPCRCGRESLA